MSGDGNFPTISECCGYPLITDGRAELIREANFGIMLKRHCANVRHLRSFRIWTIGRIGRDLCWALPSRPTCVKNEDRFFKNPRWRCTRSFCVCESRHDSWVPSAIPRVAYSLSLFVWCFVNISPPCLPLSLYKCISSLSKAIRKFVPRQMEEDTS